MPASPQTFWSTYSMPREIRSAAAIRCTLPLMHRSSRTGATCEFCPPRRTAPAAVGVAFGAGAEFRTDGFAGAIAEPVWGSIIRDFDEVVVGIADIDRLDRADGAGARSRPGDHRDTAFLEVRNDLGE